MPDQAKLDVLGRLATDQKSVAERRWNMGARPSKPQAACDIGLFSDDRLQSDLFQQPRGKSNGKDHS